MQALTILDPVLLWTVIGAVAAVITVLPILFKLLPSRLNPIKEQPTQIEVVVKDSLAPQLNVNFFPTHAAAYELTNFGKAGLILTHVLISTELIRDVTPEMFRLPEPISILPDERKLIYVERYAKRYFDAQMSARYRTGMESRQPTILVSFRYEFANQPFDSGRHRLAGRFENGTFVDIKPADSH